MILLWPLIGWYIYTYLEEPFAGGHGESLVRRESRARPGDHRAKKKATYKECYTEITEAQVYIHRKRRTSQPAPQCSPNGL